MTQTVISPVRLCAMLFIPLAAVVLMSSACSSIQKVDSKPMPAGVSFTGKWYSLQYEEMDLKESGGNVTGTFSFKEGGRLEGTLDGNVLHFDWVQKGDMSKAIREVSGKGYLIMADDGNTFTGRWGYVDDNSGGGLWDGERVEVKDKEEGFDDPIFKKKAE